MGSLVLVLLLAGDLAAAEQALAAGKPRAALELLGDLADGDDADVRALIVYGRAQLALRESEAAVEPLLRASDARPDDRALATDAAYACWGSAQGMYAMAYLEDAKRMARRAGAPLLSADIHHAAGDFEPALGFYREVADEDRTRLHVKTRIAECLRELGRDAEAKRAFGEALEEALRREDLASAYRLAPPAQGSGRFLAWLDAKLEAQPNNLWFRLYRGYARAAALMFREAAEDLRPVLAARPDDVTSKERLAFALIRYGNQDREDGAVREGQALALEVLDAAPDNESAWSWLRWLTGQFWRNGEVERAYRLSRELMRRRPDDVRTCLDFCSFARRLGHYQEAMQVFERLLDDEFDLGEILNDHAILLDGMGRRADAVRQWRRVLGEDPDNLNALENLCTDAWERGDAAALDEYIERGLAAARRRDGPVERWLWFRDRRKWAPAGFGGD